MKKALGMACVAVFLCSAAWGQTGREASASGLRAIQCFGKEVTLANVNEVSQGIEQAGYDLDALSKSVSEGQLKDDLTQMSYNYVAALELLREFASGRAFKASTELCMFTTYSCTQSGTATHAYSKQQCPRCDAIETSPPTNPRTCVTSCKLCCTAFGGSDPLIDCGCPSTDPC